MPRIAGTETVSTVTAPVAGASVAAFRVAEMAGENVRRSARHTRVLYDVESPVSGRVVVLEHRRGCNSLKRSLRFFVPARHPGADIKDCNESWDESNLVQSEVELRAKRKCAYESLHEALGFDGLDFASPSRY